MKRTSSPFKWRHYALDVILLCVRWYYRYSLSYRDLEQMMRERGLTVDDITVFRWGQCYALEINRRVRLYLKMSGASFRVDETYVEVGKSWKYLYRTVNKDGATIESMLSAKRDVSAAKRFFKKLMGPTIAASHSLSARTSTPLTQKPSRLQWKRKYYPPIVSYAE